MHGSDNEQARDHELAVLFAETVAASEQDAQFVRGVMKRIRRQERIRWLVLGGCGLIAAILAAPALWKIGAAIGGIDMSVMDALPAWLGEATDLAADYLRSAVRSITFLAAATLTIVILPLLRWLAD